MTCDEAYKLLDKLLKREVQSKDIDLSRYTYHASIRSNKLKPVFGNKSPMGSGTIFGAFLDDYTNQDVLRYVQLHNIPLYLCEDAFLRSADTWANTSVDPKYSKFTCGVMLDRHGYYFDATRHSDLELMLNDSKLTLTEEQLSEARKLIDTIVFNKLSKYNSQPIYRPKYGSPDKKKVLVVDQSGGDYSIKLGNASKDTFNKCLQSAIDENPDCDILVKIHPDVMTGKRQSNFKDLDKLNVIKISDPINPYSLLEIVDKVYVVTSQFGLEALMAGKEVHTFGMPFYAGWGLTVDDQVNNYRTNKRSLEELFYITYIKYTYWIDPINGKRVDINWVIDYLLKLREEYFKKYNVMDKIPVNGCIVYSVDTDLNNNILFLESYFSLRKFHDNIIYIITCKDNPFNYYYRNLKNVKFIYVDDYMDFTEFKSIDRLSGMSYARLLILKLSEFKDYEAILYLDTDTLICGHLDGLFRKICDSKSLIVGCQETLNNNPSIRNQLEFCKSKNLKYNMKHYINTGVLGFNLKFNSNEYYDNVIKCIKYGFPLNDQGLINWYFQSKIELIPSRYNSADFTRAYDKDNVMIIRHDAGLRKHRNSEWFGSLYNQFVYNQRLR